jgi:hypothetical protein
MESFAPVTRLSRVDLPALGAPMMATKPHFVMAYAPACATRREADQSFFASFFSKKEVLA